MSGSTLASMTHRLNLTGGAAALKVRFLGVVVFLVLLCVMFGALSPRFLSLANGRSVLFTAAILAIAAVGQSLVVLTGNLDLSVGSIMGLTAYVVFDLAGKHTALQPYVVIMALLIGAVLGLVNGFLVAVLQIPSIVATLGTLSHLPWFRLLLRRRHRGHRGEPASVDALAGDAEMAGAAVVRLALRRAGRDRRRRPGPPALGSALVRVRLQP